MMTRNCIVCGASFEAKRSNQITCLSEECKTENHKRHVREHNRELTEIGGVDVKTYKRNKMREYRSKDKMDKPRTKGKCATCKWCETDGKDEWCVNDISPFFTEFVLDDGSCEEWEKGNEYNKWKK